MARRRRSRNRWPSRLLLALVAIPALYLVAALVGSLVPVNRDWDEPARGTTVYLRSNGIHVDIVMPAVAQGLDWRPYFPRRDFADAPASPRWFGFGAGERGVFLDTPTFDALVRDLSSGPVQAGPAAPGSGEVVIGWGRHDRLCLPRQAARAKAAFPSARLVWFDSSGHFPIWDEPVAAVRVILGEG